MRRSPIQRLRDRQGGESLRNALAEEYERATYGMAYGGAAAICGITLLLNTWFGSPIDPISTGIIWLLIGIGICSLSARRLLTRGRPMKLGLQGEELVADEFRKLEQAGYSVFHDVPSRNRPGANIDHVVIGPAGVFAIETKTRRKTSRDVVHYDGNSIRVGDAISDTRPLEQAKACATELRELIAGGLTEAVEVQPVVLYPGWKVNTSRRTHWEYPVVVTTTKYFVTGLVDGRVRAKLNQAVAAAAANSLRGYVIGRSMGS